MTDGTKTIYTIDARGNILLGMTRDHFGLTGPQMNDEIWRMFEITTKILRMKGIFYNNLTSGLVPSTDKHEAAFLFDTRLIEDTSYGYECMERVLPLLEPKATLSVLVGDLIANDVDTAVAILQHLLNSLIVVNEYDFGAHPGLIFAIYITNISESRLQSMHEGLMAYEPYIGHVPTTYASPLKHYMSFILSNLFLKQGMTIIVPHEEDRSNKEDINITPYPLEKFGYKVRSLNQTYFGVFLSYKIERPVLPNFVEDSEISLNALSSVVLPVKAFRVFIEDPKYVYLIENKLSRTSLIPLGKSGLERLIELKIEQSYMYQLRVRPNYQVNSFTVMLEATHDNGGAPFRIHVALEYSPERGTLKVLTMT